MILCLLRLPERIGDGGPEQVRLLHLPPDHNVVNSPVRMSIPFVES
jgi:hypothetical protein